MKHNKYLVFKTSEELFIAPIADILTIEKLEYYENLSDYKHKTIGNKRRETIKKVNAFPSYIEGVVTHKEYLVPVIEFELFFNKKKINRHEENKIILFKGTKHDYGLLVDNVLSIIELNPNSFKKMYEELPLFIVEKNQEVYIYPELDKIIWKPELLDIFEKLNVTKEMN